MTLIMHMALWLATTLGVPIPDSALPDGACGGAVAASGTASTPVCSTENRNMRKTWRIYNGF